jgi:hypothetical protein
MLKFFCAVALLISILLAPATADAASKNKCNRWGAKHGVEERTAHGVLFAKSTSDGQDLYGCLFRAQRARNLGQQPQGLPERATMDGRYAAYFTVTADDEDFQGFVTGVPVSDLKTGEVVTQAPLLKGVQPSSQPPSPGGSLGPIAGRIVLRGNGLANGGNPDGSLNAEYEVLKVPVRGGQAESLDKGKAIDPDSLAKSRSGTTFSWTNAGVSHSSPLGP